MTEEINYGYDRLEHVTIKIPEYKYRQVISELAAQEINKDGKVTIDKDWGYSVELVEIGDGFGVTSEKFALVEFHRRIKEE